MSKVYISAGHSGPGENGAIGLINERVETIQLVKAIYEQVSKNGNCSDLMAVTSGSALTDRIKQVNRWCGKNGVAIEIHFNSVTDTAANGTECMISAKAGVKTKMMAESIAEMVSKTLGTRNRGVKTDNKSGLGYLGFVSKTKPTAIILEPCFVRNHKDTELYRSHFTELVTAMSEVITNILKS